MNDATSFFLAFTALFALLAASLVRLEMKASRLEARLAMLEAGRPPAGESAPRDRPSGRARPGAGRREGDP